MSKIAKFWATVRKKPYVEVVSDYYDPEHGWQIKLDWNKQFVNYLAKEGIEGDTEDEMVHTWLNLLMRSSEYEEYEAELMNQAHEQGRKANADDFNDF